MKKKTFLLIFAGFTTSLFLTSCTTEETQETEIIVENNYLSTTSSPDSLCLTDPSWFPHSQTPEPNEGNTSPFANSSTTNAIFHQWSWQKFLWLTKPDTNGTPLFLNPSKVHQISSKMDLITVPQGATVVLQDTQQAGSKQAVLTTNPDYNKSQKSETVYYSIHMNPIMYKHAIKFAKEIINKIIPDSNSVMFPVGSFELKVSWVPVDAIPEDKQADYFTTTAHLSTDNGKTFQNTTVALIGMHVVGVVENHPEFIWATFEHDDLAPNYDWKANSASSASNQLLFKKGSVQGIGGILYDTATKHGTPPYQVFDLFEYGVPRDPSGSFMATSQDEPENFTNIQGINSCVKQNLNDVWSHYFYNGSIWLNMDGTTPERQAYIIDSLGYNISNAGKGSYARGSLNCANVTMETFTQTFKKSIGDISASNLANCFSCHSSPTFQSGSNATSPLYLSHVFQDYLSSQRGRKLEEIERIKLKNEQRVTEYLQSK